MSVRRWRKCPRCEYPGAASEFRVVDPYAVSGAAWRANAERECPLCGKIATTSEFRVIANPEATL